MTRYSLRKIALAGFSFAGLLASPAVAWADDGSGLMSTASLLVDIGLFLVILACLLSVFKIHASVRGGKIALGWRWFMGGFGLLGVAQILLFIGEAGLLAMSSGVWVGLMRICALGLFLVGATRMRKLLT